jgi:hypothetical protein
LTQKGKIVLITFPFDQGDILEDFLEWHLDLGVDQILALDCGSTDGSRQVLDRYSRTRNVTWLPLPERDTRKYSADNSMAALARDRYDADWIIHCDVDEFLCSHGPDVRTVLAEAERDDITLLELPRHGITGALEQGKRATQALTLRIDRPTDTTQEQNVSGDLPVPFVFVRIRGHLAVRASALEAYGSGAEVATTRWGKSVTSDHLYILHYAIRGYDEFRTKVDNTEAWLRENAHLSPGWGWHWRRWIRLKHEGRLREDYEAQFVSPERAQQLMDDGTCRIDESVARWASAREAGRRPWSGLAGLMQRLTSPFHGKTR